MESVEKEKATLISDIEADARLEAEGILKEAQDRAAQKRTQGQRQIESILNDARKQAQDQAQAVKRTMLSAVELEVKRRSMRARDLVMRQILDRAEKKLSSLIGDADYRAVLIGWMTEAAVGLGAKSAQVNASQAERPLIDDQMLSEVREKLRARTGGEVGLSMSSAPPLPSQGIVLTAADGRTAFNNQVPTRMLRHHREIRKLIYDILFTDREKA